MICARQEFQSFFSSVPPAQKEKEKEKEKGRMHCIVSCYIWSVVSLSMRSLHACTVTELLRRPEVRRRIEDERLPRACLFDPT
jgi:hypothetical protein